MKAHCSCRSYHARTGEHADGCPVRASPGHLHPCAICGEPRAKKGQGWCSACTRSYDRDSFSDGTVAAAVEWAAERARKFERRRWIRGLRNRGER